MTARLLQANEAEVSVLGCVMLDNSAIDRVAGTLSAESFYAPRHRTVFGVMLELHKAGSPLDAITLSQALDKAGQLDRVGGVDYLMTLSEASASAVNVEHHAQLVKDNADLRALQGVMQDVHTKANSGNFDSPTELVNEAMQRTLAIAAGRASRGKRKFTEVLKSTLKGIQHAYEHKGELQGLTTGLRDLDAKLAGLKPGELDILAARPAMGKTSLALDIVRAMSKTCTVAFCSLEMPAEQLTARLLAQQGQVSAERMRTGHLTEGDIDRLLQATKVLSRHHIDIDDQPGKTVPEMRTWLAQLNADKSTPPVGALVVDYLQLIGADRSIRSREQQIADISRSLKELAKAYNIPVLCLSQLNRGVESRPNKRPLLSDLRESGAIEQDADVVMMLYRDEYYNESSDDKGVAEVIVAKQRGGSTGTVKVRWVAEQTRFETLIEGGQPWR